MPQESRKRRNEIILTTASPCQREPRISRFGTSARIANGTNGTIAINFALRPLGSRKIIEVEHVGFRHILKECCILLSEKSCEINWALQIAHFRQQRTANGLCLGVRTEIIVETKKLPLIVFISFATTTTTPPSTGSSTATLGCESSETTLIVEVPLTATIKISTSDKSGVDLFDVTSLLFLPQHSIGEEGAGTIDCAASFVRVEELENVDVEIHFIDAPNDARLDVSTFGVFIEKSPKHSFKFCRDILIKRNVFGAERSQIEVELEVERLVELVVTVGTGLLPVTFVTVVVSIADDIRAFFLDKDLEKRIVVVWVFSLALFELGDSNAVFAVVDILTCMR